MGALAPRALAPSRGARRAAYRWRCSPYVRDQR